MTSHRAVSEPRQNTPITAPSGGEGQGLATRSSIPSMPASFAAACHLRRWLRSSVLSPLKERNALGRVACKSSRPPQPSPMKPASLQLDFASGGPTPGCLTSGSVAPKVMTGLGTCRRIGAAQRGQPRACRGPSREPGTQQQPDPVTHKSAFDGLRPLAGHDAPRPGTSVRPASARCLGRRPVSVSSRQS